MGFSGRGLNDHVCRVKLAKLGLQRLSLLVSLARISLRGHVCWAGLTRLCLLGQGLLGGVCKVRPDEWGFAAFCYYHATLVICLNELENES